MSKSDCKCGVNDWKDLGYGLVLTTYPPIYQQAYECKVCKEIKYITIKEDNTDGEEITSNFGYKKRDVRNTSDHR